MREGMVGGEGLENELEDKQNSNSMRIARLKIYRTNSNIQS